MSRATSRLGDAVETLAELQTDVIGAAPRWRAAQAAQAFTAVVATEIDPTRDVLTALLGDRRLPSGAELSPPAPALLLNVTQLANRLVAPPRQVLDPEGHPVQSEPLEVTDGVYEQFPEQFHDVAYALRMRRIAPGSKARLSVVLADADELFTHVEAPVVIVLAGLAGGHETARRRLRLLLALDAMMLWRPDGVTSAHEDWWAEDDDVACFAAGP